MWNDKGIWLREIEILLRRFDVSLEWFLERVDMADEEMDRIRQNGGIEANEKDQTLNAKMKNITDDVEGSGCVNRH